MEASKKGPVGPDIRFENHGSVALCVPLTDVGREWISDNVQTESWQWMSGALAMEPRYVHALTKGMIYDGLEVAK